jgi:hypothetical protein
VCFLLEQTTQHFGKNQGVCFLLEQTTQHFGKNQGCVFRPEQTLFSDPNKSRSNYKK